MKSNRKFSLSGLWGVLILFGTILAIYGRGNDWPTWAILLALAPLLILFLYIILLALVETIFPDKDNPFIW